VSLASYRRWNKVLSLDVLVPIGLILAVVDIDEKASIGLKIPLRGEIVFLILEEFLNCFLARDGTGPQWRFLLSKNCLDERLSILFFCFLLDRHRL